LEIKLSIPPLALISPKPPSIFSLNPHLLPTRSIYTLCFPIHSFHFLCKRKQNLFSFSPSTPRLHNNHKHLEINFNQHPRSINSCHGKMKDQRANDPCFSFPHPRAKHHHLHQNPNFLSYKFCILDTCMFKCCTN
jgi:hypothetical protein